jgi:hypothetical protein
MHTATAAVSAASPVATAEEEAPGLLDTYALLYAFTLLWLVPALVLLAALPMYSYSNAYAALVALPPVAGMISLLLTDRERPGWRALLGRTVLLVALATTGSVAFIFVGMMLIPVVAGLIASHIDLFGAMSVVSLVIVSAPLLPVLVRMVRGREWLRVAVLLLALVGVGVVLYLTVTPAKTLVTALRKDQVSFLVGGLTWYLPAYGAAGAICRALGLG